MKLKLIWASLLLAGVAGGQTEQWLEYRTGDEALSFQSLPLTTNPPPGITPPACNATPYWSHWKTALDPAGRWVCFDRSRKSGPYDLLYVDADGKGHLERQTPLKGRLDSYNAFFPAAAFTFKGEDGPIAYHLAFRFYQYDKNLAQLLISSAGWYEGNVDFGGTKKHLRLIDGNVNGTFNDMDANAYGSDRLAIDGDKAGERYLGRMIEVDGKFFQIEVARDGAYVKVHPAENVRLGTVKVPDNISECSAYGPEGYFVRQPTNSEFTLPAGRYGLVRWTIKRNDEKGVPWTLSGYNFPDSARFNVAADGPATLKIGEPVQAELKANEQGNRQISFSLNFVGQQRESIELLRDGQRPRGPKLMLAAADGAVCYTNTFEFG